LRQTQGGCSQGDGCASGFEKGAALDHVEKLLFRTKTANL
jgi:hypothetical protein